MSPRPDHLPAIRTAALLVLATAIVAAFAGATRNGWVYLDDPTYVYENPHVTHGLTLDGLRWFLHEPHGGNWHPLTSVLHMLDVQLFGLQPAGHHAVSIAFHLLNALLLVIFLARLTGAWWKSLAVSALFALHPLRVESVAWVSELKDVASGLFFLLTIEAYRRWVAKPGNGRYAFLLVTFALGLMSKPMLVTLPVVLVLLDFWPLGRLGAPGAGPARNAEGRAPARSLAGLLAEKWPLLLLAMASSVVTLVVQHHEGAVASVGAISIERRVCNSLISCWRYIGKTAWPADLSVFYPNNRAANVPGAIASALGLSLATWLVLRWRRSRPYLAVGWLWYLIMLLPVIGLIQVGGQAYADRYTYLPTIGLLVALVWVVGSRVPSSRGWKIAAAAGLTVVLVALGVRTTRQIRTWKDTHTLFTNALAVTPTDPIAHLYLGDLHALEGRSDLALPEYEAAIRLAPEFAEARNSLGSSLGAAGRYDEAIAQLRIAVRLNPRAYVHHNLAFTFERAGRLDEAIVEYRAALGLDRDFYNSVLFLGTALAKKGNLAESEGALRHAVELMPSDANARRALAITLTRMGHVEEAISEYSAILNSDPGDLDALNNVAWIRATHAEENHRNGTVAVRLAESARDRSPTPVAVIFSTLSAAYAESGRFPEAIRACERAIEIAKLEADEPSAARFAQQLTEYRAGRPFHFH